MEKPTLLDGPEDIKLRALLRKYIDHLDSNESNDDTDSDYKHYIYEEVITAYFGKNVWNWINKRTVG